MQRKINNFDLTFSFLFTFGCFSYGKCFMIFGLPLMDGLAASPFLIALADLDGWFGLVWLDGVVGGWFGLSWFLSFALHSIRLRLQSLLSWVFVHSLLVQFSSDLISPRLWVSWIAAKLKSSWILIWLRSLGISSFFLMHLFVQWLFVF